MLEHRLHRGLPEASADPVADPAREERHQHEDHGQDLLIFGIIDVSWRSRRRRASRSQGRMRRSARRSTTIVEPRNFTDQIINFRADKFMAIGRKI